MNHRPVAMIAALAWAAIFLAAVAPAPARAHPLRFGVLHLAEHPDGTVDVDFRFSGTEGRPSQVTARLPERCKPVGEELRAALAYGEARRLRVDCGPRGLAGATVGVAGLADRGVQTAVHIDRADGRTVTATLSVDDPTFRVPAAGDAPSPFVDYLALGVEHIAGGVDHLMFVLGLVLLVGLRRRLVGTLTAFTAGHSITLAAASLGYAHVPQAPVEAGIALSIVLLAAELATELRVGRGAPSLPAPPPTLTRRHPGLVAGVFGLLHGLGFAGALSEVGLDRGHLVLSLFGFNLGVEVGQLLFVGLVLAGMLAARQLRLTPGAWARPAAIYALGIGGTFFLVDRVAAFV